MRLSECIPLAGTGVRVSHGAGTPAGYLDGAEAHLLERLSRVRDRRTGSSELEGLIRDWPSEYHLTPLRATLFDAFSFDAPAARVLELGAGCGAITRWLGEHCGTVHAIEGDLARARVARERCADLGNVEVYAGNFSELEPEGRYDLVTLIGVLEYGHLYHPAHRDDPARAAVANLAVAREALAEDGVLVLAIENALGLKYFGGAREDHSSLPWDSLHGYPRKGAPVTWSRRQLEGLLREAGFEQLDLFLPFPDYKLPSTIVNAAEIRDADALHNWIPTPAPDRGAVRGPSGFSETLAQREIARGGLLAEMSNSFLFLAWAGDAVRGRNRLGVDSAWVARHWSTSRSASFAKRVTLRPDADSVEVERPPMLPSDSGGAALAAARAAGLRQTLAPEPYRRGDRLLYDVIGALRAGGFDATWVEHLRRFGSWLDERYAIDGRPGMLRPDAVDVTWWNVIAHPKTAEWAVIDREWQLGDAIPRDFVLWRMLRHFALRHGSELPEPWREPDAVAFADHWLPASCRERAATPDAAFLELDDLVATLVSPRPPAEPDGGAEADGHPWVLVLADQLEPAVLAGYAAAVRPGEAVTLAIYAPGWSEAAVAGSVERAAEQAGVALDAYDVIALPLEPGADSDAAVAGRASALLTPRSATDFPLRPVFTPVDAAGLRELLLGRDA